jgi:CubicO group peptidase (beta-lactamase class C family)
MNSFASFRRRTAAVLGLLLGLAASAALAAPAVGLPRATPESQGVSSAGLVGFVEALDRIEGMHSVMVVRHGRVVAEGWWTPYNPGSRHELYSLSKSFTSTAVGLAVAEGKVSIDDPVLKFFPEEAPAEPSGNLRAMRVRDLLTMSTGHQDEAPVFGGISRKSFFDQPVPHKPGTHFKYNTPATYMQSAIVQKVTGQTVLEYLRPRLFEPLGIEDPTWGRSEEGVSLGGYGLSVRTEDIARFGQLYLQQGRWHGKQLVPAAWVAMATARQVSNGSNPESDWDQGYGFQFWRCRHGGYRGDGAFGQYCVVLPEQDAVLAITGGVRDMQAVLNVVWDRLLPAFHPRRLGSDKAARGKLAERLAGLTLRGVEGAATTPVAARVAGRRYAFAANDQRVESVTLEPGADGRSTMLVVRGDGGESRIACGRGVWVNGRAALSGRAEEPVAACGAWTAEDTFTAKVCLVETPFTVTVRLRFAGDEVFHDSEVNVAFGATKRPQLQGRAESR